MVKMGLSDQDLRAITGIIDGWSDAKISWDKLVAAIHDRLGWQYTRQALNKYAEIKNAFQVRQSTLRGSRGKSFVRSIELQKANERINLLEAKVKRLESENTLLKEQLVRWLKNATDDGIRLERLDQPLAKPDREMSKQPRKKADPKVSKRPRK